jgi:hypothetical protein
VKNSKVYESRVASKIFAADMQLPWLSLLKVCALIALKLRSV